MCLSAVVIVLCLAATDVALSLSGLVPTIEDQRARSIAYSFGLQTRHRLVAKDILVGDGGAIHINRRGFRGREIDTRKDPGVVRILFLGGSQVFGFRGGDWPSTVGEKLRRLGYAVETINAGVPGHTTFDSLGKLLADAWTLEPDIIVLCQAWNDIKYFRWLTAETPYRGPAPTRPLSWRKDWRLYPDGVDRVLSFSSIYRQFRWGIANLFYFEEGDRRINADDPAGPDNSITPWGPKQYRLNVNLIADLAESIGAELVICKQAKLATAGGGGEAQKAAREYGRRNTGLVQKALMRAFATTYSIIDKIAEVRGIGVVDMNGALSGRKTYFRDGIHFSVAGGRAASELVAETLLPLVARAAGGRASQ